MIWICCQTVFLCSSAYRDPSNCLDFANAMQRSPMDQCLPALKWNLVMWIVFSHRCNFVIGGFCSQRTRRRQNINYQFYCLKFNIWTLDTDYAITFGDPGTLLKIPVTVLNELFSLWAMINGVHTTKLLKGNCELLFKMNTRAEVKLPGCHVHFVSIFIYRCLFFFVWKIFWGTGQAKPRMHISL